MVLSNTRRWTWLVMLLVVSPVAAQDQPPLLLRAESMTLLPRSQPMLYVQVANTTDQSVSAQVSVTTPPSWRVAQRMQAVELAAGAESRLGFSVAEGAESKENRYEIEIAARADGGEVVRRQVISVASAPYFKPAIDGDPGDWQDAIPLTFTTESCQTTISTCWSRRQFCLLVSVAEAKHIPRGGSEHFDAVQFAIAPRDSRTGRSPEDEAARFEYLVFVDAAGRGVGCQLITPGEPLSAATRLRPLDSLVDSDVQVAVSRSGDVTHYEIRLPLTEIRKWISPSEGRQFYLGLLVHDPDGTGLRDWGVAAGMWPQQRNRLAWCVWEGAKWEDMPPMDCRTEWGMCSSRY